MGVEESTKLISYLDTLQYFASNNYGESFNVLKKLAFRLPLDEGGAVDRAKNQITFEAFDIVASLDPGLAISHIYEITDIFKEAYIYHYIVGRKMAGIQLKDSVEEVRRLFEAKFIPKDL